MNSFRIYEIIKINIIFFIPCIKKNTTRPTHTHPTLTPIYVTLNQVPINGGAKLTGTLGRLELGVMDVDTRSSGPNPYANYAVVRLKESLWPGSYVGVMGIDKRSGSQQDSFNQTGGVDTRLVFFKDWFVD